MSSPENPIVMPPFCAGHNHEIVHEAKYSETDPWRALIVITQVAMFQGMTTTPSVHKRVGGDVTKIATLGCFACRLPGKWKEVIRASKVSLEAIKELGEKWVAGGLNNQENL